METIIGRYPPQDGREWECQCARCGSSMSFDECETCGGEGLDGHDCGEDCCMCLDPEPNMRCDSCRGAGYFPTCLSSEAHCQGNPRPGREAIERHTPEWYCIEPPPTPPPSSG